MKHRTRNLFPLALVLIALFVASALAPAALSAQAAAAADSENATRDLELVKPESVGMSSEGIAKVDAAMKALVDSGELAGVVMMITRHGKMVYNQAHGKRDLATGEPIDEDTIVRIYSMTKPVAGVALMTLWEEGKFKLDDPVEKYLPEFAKLKVAKEDGPDGMPVVEDPVHPMTIRELMSHTGGLTYGLFSRTQVDQLYVKRGILDRDSTLAEMVTKLADIPLMSQPGTRWQYSVSVDVQGRLVEVLAGKPFDQVLEERIFKPLGMKDTAFWVEESKRDRFARLYVPNSDGVLEPQPEDEYMTKPNLLSGGGGLVSTAVDYIKFAQMLANGGEFGGARILEPETVALMATNHLPDSIPGTMFFPGHQFGLDFAIVNKPNPKTESPLAKSEFWWFGIGGTWFGVNPTQDLVVLGMIQNRGGAGANKARLMSKKLAYEAILDPVE